MVGSDDHVTTWTEASPMSIWQGWGILVVLIGALFTVPLGFGAASLLGEENAAVGAGTGLILAAIAVYLAGNKLNAPVQGYDPSTGQPVMYRKIGRASGRDSEYADGV